MDDVSLLTCRQLQRLTYLLYSMVLIITIQYIQFSSAPNQRIDKLTMWHNLEPFNIYAICTTCTIIGTVEYGNHFTKLQNLDARYSIMPVKKEYH